MKKLSNNARMILNNEIYIENQKEWIKRLENLFDRKSDSYLDEYVFMLNGIEGCDLHTLLFESEKYLPEDYIINCMENLACKVLETQKDYIFAPICITYIPYVVHFVDKIFGANVFYKNNQWWCEYIKTPIGCLTTPDLDKNKVFDLAKRACNAFLEQNVKLPLFGLPTIASALNIIINLYGQEILLAMLTNPEEVKHDLRIIQDVLVNLHKWYLNTLPIENLQPVLPSQRAQPYNYGQICGCSTALISSECYNEFIKPLDEELLGVYHNGGMIHLCGNHLQHVKSFHNMKKIRSVQINDRAAHDLKTYYQELRNDQIIYLNPCEGMTVDMAIDITGGDRLVLVGDHGGPVKRRKNDIRSDK